MVLFKTLKIYDSVEQSTQFVPVESMNDVGIAGVLSAAKESQVNSYL